jgi:NADH-ubiquinone oxidoreductase chain 5
LGFINFVTLIAGVVMFYRNIYIHGDLREKRFIILVNLFVASMGILIFSPNILSLMLGWDGLGLVSFLLVIYYYNIPSLKSGLVTIYTNRVGDAAMIFALYYFYDGGN